SWRINLWARLRDGERANRIVNRLLSPDRTYPNLFDAHPPFQIDGNFGGAAGVLEMLVQSRIGEISLFPALPADWPSGHVRGVRARGDITVDLAWRGATLTAELRTGQTQQIVVRANGHALELTLRPSAVVRVEGDVHGLAVEAV
ncbi:MAG: glycosyl hydrolase family 95 catalytic domain-containing protein, partial [Devosia sp.]